MTDALVSPLWHLLVYSIKRQFRYVISSVWHLLVYPIKRQFRYVISSEGYAQDLQKEVGKLAYQADWVHIALEEARNNRWTVYGTVEDWHDRAKRPLEEAICLLDNFEKASKTCCYGTLPDLSCLYQFSKMAMGMIEDIQRLVQLGNEFKDLDDISYNDISDNDALAIVNSMPIKLREDDVSRSRASIAQNIMDALASNKINVVGVYGMGGVGKSTLLVYAERRIREQKRFDVIAKADVSQNPDIKRIQEDIASSLGFSNIKNRETISGRAKLLHRRLEEEERNEKKVLIILDDLWAALDLKSVGIPCGYDNYVKGCKLLLTSRDRSVLRWQMGCDKNFRLDKLNEEEAKILFEKMVGGKVHDAEFKPWVDDALHKCAGLPFLIVAMAKLLKDVDLSKWEETLKEIGKSKHEGFGEVINNVLQLSYDHLDEEVKSFLKLCVSYGDSKPSLENLVKYSVDLGLIREDSSMGEARDKLNSLIRTLQDSSLLLDNGDADGFKIHNIVRKFVDSVASRDQSSCVG